MDGVTGLLGRCALHRQLRAVLRQRRPRISLLICDIDDFRHLNYVSGFAAGDHMLREIARRLTALAAHKGIVYRLGADEFGILTDGEAEPAAALALGEGIRQSGGEPVEIMGREVRLGVSVGVAHSSISGLEVEALLRDAEIALRRAKEAGGNRCHLLHATERTRAVARIEIEEDVRDAIATDSIAVHYQPIVRLDGTVVGVEALARWTCPGRGRVAPSEFIAIAESGGMIEQIGRIVLHTAADQVARWRRRIAPSLQLSVNLSVRQLDDPSLTDSVVAALEGAGLPPDALCLELTETALLDDPIKAESSLADLHRLGIRIAVDDFGVGYASLLYVSSFPVDVMKLDRHFVAGLGRDTTDALIVGSVIQLAQSLGIVSVAEGVETVEQLGVLKRLRCEFGQGYYFARPGSAAKTARLLNRVLPDNSEASVTR